MKDYNILKIPFFSKSMIFGKGEYKYTGVAYYFIDDKNNIFHEYCQFDLNAKIRINCPTFLGEENYKNLKLIFPKEGASGYFKTSKKIRLENNYIFSERKISCPSKMKKLNLIIRKEMSTVLQCIGLITGSNSTGADSDVKKSQVLYYNSNDRNDKWNTSRFASFLNLKIVSYSSQKRKKIRSHYIESYGENFFDIESKIHNNNFINFDFYLNNILSKDFYQNIFINHYNYEFDSQLDNEIIQNKIDDNYIEFKKDFYSYEKWESIIEAIEKFSLKNFIDNEELIKKLRRIYLKNINYFIYSKLGITNHLDVNIPIAEKAHIISFSYLVKNGRYLDATSPFNLLFLDSNTHKLFDKNMISISPNGDFVINQKLRNEEIKIIKQTLLPNRVIDYWLNFKEESNKLGVKQYILENYDNFINKGSNL